MEEDSTSFAMLDCLLRLLESVGKGLIMHEVDEEEEDEKEDDAEEDDDNIVERRGVEDIRLYLSSPVGSTSGGFVVTVFSLLDNLLLPTRLLASSTTPDLDTLAVVVSAV